MASIFDRSARQDKGPRLASRSIHSSLIQLYPWTSGCGRVGPGRARRDDGTEDVELSYLAPDRSTRWIDRTITLHGPLDDEQRAKLAEIAEKTPVTKAVRAGTEIRTTVEQD